MQIGGFQNLTLSDYPGKVAAIIFTQGCNLRCPFCHNGQLTTNGSEKSSQYSEEAIYKFLEERSSKLDGVVITGGEPTIHHDLPNFILNIRKLGYSIKLDTNGTIPSAIKYLIDNKLVDFIAMDIKASLEKYHELSGTPVATDNILESIAIISKSGIDHEFRTTKVDALLSDEDITAIQQLVPQGSKHYFQKFIAENAMEPDLINQKQTLTAS